MTEIGKTVEFSSTLSQPEIGRFLTIPSNLYVIYDANAQFLGMSKDAVLREAIISAYIRLKTVTAVIQLYNQSILERVAAKALHVGAPKDDSAKSSFEYKNYTVTVCTNNLIDAHANAKTVVEKALTMLRASKGD